MPTTTSFHVAGDNADEADADVTAAADSLRNKCVEDALRGAETQLQKVNDDIAASTGQQGTEDTKASKLLGCFVKFACCPLVFFCCRWFCPSQYLLPCFGSLHRRKLTMFKRASCRSASRIWRSLWSFCPATMALGLS